MPLPPDDVRAKLAQLRNEFAMRAALQSEYDKEMSGKYIHQMIPFEDWLAQRNAPTGKAKGGSMTWQEFKKHLHSQNLTDSFGPVEDQEKSRWASAAERWELKTVDPRTLKPVSHQASNHPVIIAPDGDVLDGRNRIAHAINQGHKAVNAWVGLSKASGGSVMGINVASDRKAGRRYADLIVDGHKTLESRNGDSLRPYVGKRVAIVRTGEGPAKAIGEVTIGEPMVVNKKKFRSLEGQHHVPEGSAYDISTPTKHLYPLHDPVRYEKERDVGHGIVSRKVVHEATGGSIPSLDVMRLAIGGQGPRNWIKGSVEHVIEPLKKYDLPDLFPEFGEPPPNSDANKAVNLWIERNLANYIRKQMGGHDDPIRKLAEQGITHLPEDQMHPANYQQFAEANRKDFNAPRLGESPEAQRWEDVADSVLMPSTVDQVKKSFPDQYEPWMDKASPDTKIFRPVGMHADYTGFDHIVDILKEDLAQGRIRPEQLSKVSIEQAVRRAHQYDQERKKAMAETALKATEGMPVHKDYGDGFKWIELTKPAIDPNEPMPEKYEARLPHPNSWGLFDKTTGKYVATGLESAEHARQHALDIAGEKKLAEALKYEGDTMGHCVGGYCPDVSSGETRIFSLRDAKNEPHVTIEVRPETNVEGFSSGQIQLLKSHGKYAEKPSIRQIKGKGNAKPKKDYIPYVQDFVKSGNWSDVDDLQNAEMHHAGNLYTNNERKNLERLTGENMDYVAHQDIPKHRELLKQHNVPPLLPDNKAGGGEVDAEEVFMGKGGKVKEPKKTTKAYKLFRVHEKHPGKLFPLFVNANQPVEIGKWVDAEVGPQTDTGKVKSKLGPLAYRPGWHSGDLPVATHIGGGGAPPTHRPKNHVWAEVEVPNDVDWQTEADKRGMNKAGKLIARNAHITDQIPTGGHYRYKTNPNMTGNWLISGSMKVNRVLSQQEVERINKKAGVADLPRIEPFNKKEFGFKKGGEVDPESMFFPKSKE